jgi:nucleoside-diphosphate-sugar epimerase
MVLGCMTTTKPAERSAGISGGCDDGEQVRSNTYVDDVIEALIIADKINSQNSIYNVAGNESISLNTAIKCISENLGKSALLKYGNVRDGDQLTTEGKSHLLTKEFGWRPRVNFETGIQMQIEHFLKNKMAIG